MTARPLVSVVIPVFNGERFLGQALDSAFAQDWQPLEVILIDDGSTDATAEVARARPVTYLHQDHQGVSGARNAGVAAARGEFVAFLDADDVWCSGSLERRVRYLVDNPGVGFVLAHMEIFLEPGTPQPHWWAPGWNNRPQHGQLQTFVGRREAMATVGPFDRTFDIGEDVEWLARAKDLGVRGELLPDVCTRYRVHELSTTYGRETAAPSVARALAMSLARRRAAARNPVS
jgi:glycosyltransferase involved in cell wall biosynthesis